MMLRRRHTARRPALTRRRRPLDCHGRKTILRADRRQLAEVLSTTPSVGRGSHRPDCLVVGPEPFVQFVRDEIPQLASGASFPQTEAPSTFPVNQSIYGFTVKLRALGLVWLDQAAGKHVAQRYALLSAALAAVLGRCRAPAAGILVLSAAWQVGAVAVNVWAAWPTRAAHMQGDVVSSGAASVVHSVRRN
jgi:hypothetical protein